MAWVLKDRGFEDLGKRNAELSSKNGRDKKGVYKLNAPQEIFRNCILYTPH